MNIRDLKLFRTFLVCVRSVQGNVNFSALANECDISHNTAKAWCLYLKAATLYFFYSKRARLFHFPLALFLPKR